MSTSHDSLSVSSYYTEDKVSTDVKHRVSDAILLTQKSDFDRTVSSRLRDMDLNEI